DGGRSERNTWCNTWGVGLCHLAVLAEVGCSLGVRRICYKERAASDAVLAGRPHSGTKEHGASGVPRDCEQCQNAAADSRVRARFGYPATLVERSVGRYRSPGGSAEKCLERNTCGAWQECREYGSMMFHT